MAKQRIRKKTQTLIPQKHIVCIGLLTILLDQTVLQQLESKEAFILWNLISGAILIVLACWANCMLSQAVRKKAVFERRRSQHTVDKKQLEQSEKLTMVGVLAAGIAHEIRNPLTSLKGFIQLLRERNPEYTSIMLTEIDRINGIVTELLMLAKPKEGQSRPHKLSHLLLNVTMLLEAQANLLDLRLVSRFESDAADALVYCDENKLKQVFINIIKNAMESMKNGGDITISLWRSEGSVITGVADQGSGIPHELLTQLGKPFMTTKEGGTGLGLMVTHSIIQEHRGSMKITSEPGRGTNVEIRLPEYDNMDSEAS